MFLKTEQFEYNGVSVTLSELSALQRFDYIKFVSDAEQQETTKHYVVHINQRYLETVPCLWRCRYGITIPSEDKASPKTEMQQIRREVMLGWPADALNQATNRVLYLSGMYELTGTMPLNKPGKQKRLSR
ncbi:phage minor tail protein G [Escherichia coli]|nr:phage minor tail protein G [Escherichia coli]